MSYEEVRIQLLESRDEADAQVAAERVFRVSKKQRVSVVASLAEKVLWNTQDLTALDWDVAVLWSSQPVDVRLATTLTTPTSVQQSSYRLAPGGVAILSRGLHVWSGAGTDPFDGADADIAEITVQESLGAEAHVQARLYKLYTG